MAYSKKSRDRIFVHSSVPSSSFLTLKQSPRESAPDTLASASVKSDRMEAIIKAQDILIDKTKVGQE